MKDSHGFGRNTQNSFSKYFLLPAFKLFATSVFHTKIKDKITISIKKSLNITIKLWRG